MGEVVEVVDELKETEQNWLQTAPKANDISFKRLTIQNPDEKVLIKDLTLSIEPGTNVCIRGDNGVGKTSLFRVLSGIWSPISGMCSRPAHDPTQFFCAPQKCYLVSGTLRDQVTYPH